MSQMKNKVIDHIRANGGYIRPKDLRDAGFYINWVYYLLGSGDLERIARGLYRLTEHPIRAFIGFVEVSRQVPTGIICLRSALDYYELTTYNPPIIDIAVPRGTHRPKITYPPVNFWVFSEKMFTAGMSQIKIEQADVRIYEKEKTICDCFRFRNKIGTDLAKEGLKEYLKLKERNIPKLLDLAEICRIKPLLRTYLDAML